MLIVNSFIVGDFIVVSLVILRVILDFGFFWCSFMIFVYIGLVKYILENISYCGRNEWRVWVVIVIFRKFFFCFVNFKLDWMDKIEESVDFFDLFVFNRINLSYRILGRYFE